MGKFKKGDRVRIVKYGHLTWYSNMEALRQWHNLGKDFMDIMIWGDLASKLPKTREEEDLSHMIYEQNGNSITVDHSKHLVGQIGTVEGSYKDLYGGENEPRNEHIYSIEGIPEKTAWYDEEQLELYEE